MRGLPSALFVEYCPLLKSGGYDAGKSVDRLGMGTTIGEASRAAFLAWESSKIARAERPVFLASRDGVF